MGLSDRDYYRQPQPSAAAAGVSALRLVSVNTWLIILCVAIFIIDHFTPVLPQETGKVQWFNPKAALLDRDRVAVANRFFPDPNKPGVVLQPVVEKASGNVIGAQEVMMMHTLEKYLHFSTRLGFLGLQWWRFVGFQFLHANTMHLVFNMIGLFFFGPIAEEHLGRKRYLAFYLLCGIFGAIMYLLLNLLGFIVESRYGVVGVPGLLFSDTSTPLMGASAGIFGVIMAGAYLAPRAMVLYFFIPMQLRTFAYLLVALALFSLFTGAQNAGGEAGHIGGAIAGFYFIRRPHHLHNFFDILGRADPTSHHYRADRPGQPQQRWRRTAADPGEVDRILEKINRTGLHSLSDEEKRTLAEASER